MQAAYHDLHIQSSTANYSGEPRGAGASRTTETIAIRELPNTQQREYEAVCRAVKTTERMNGGRDRIKLIDMVFWKRSHTLQGAALAIPCSYRTARRWHTEFIILAASLYGLLDK